MSAIERNAGREMLDAAPLAAAVRRDAALELLRVPRLVHARETGIEELADRIGWDGKALDRILAAPRISLDKADRYCCATGRSLYDLYPELLDEAEGYVAHCRTCRCDVDHDVIGEGRERIQLRCRDCRRGRYITRQQRGAPVNPFPRISVSDDDVVAAYRSGLTLMEVAAKLGFAHGSSVAARLARIGEPRRRSYSNAETLQAAATRARAARSEIARERWAELERLWLAGWDTISIAERIGVKPGTVFQVRWRLGLPTRRPVTRKQAI